MTPAVTVLMPVYNAGRFVAETVETVLAQTMREFEFLIIDDGSTDDSLTILQAYAAKDDRIRLISRPNTGYVAALNEGLEKAAAPLIARLDADDLSDPRRLELQLARMNAEPELVALGSNANAIDELGRPLGAYAVPLTHAEIEASHLRGSSAIHHPAVMLRAAAVREVGGYRRAYMPCEDFDLWLRLAEVGRVANLPEPLLTKRLFVGSAVATHLDRQQRLVREILADAWRRRHLPGEPTLPPRKLAGRADLYRQWGWMALKGGHVATGRRYAVKALAEQPFDKASWRLAACALRGR